jgi:hypothetical protein
VKRQYPLWVSRRKSPVVLRSWREIGNYLHRGVRTVQRWEFKLGMPVHRFGSTQRSAVVAFQHELDAWIEHGSRLRATTDSSRRSLLSLTRGRKSPATCIAASAPYSVGKPPLACQFDASAPRHVLRSSPSNTSLTVGSRSFGPLPTARPFT